MTIPPGSRQLGPSHISTHKRQRARRALGLFLCLATFRSLFALTLHPAASSGSDLVVTGELVGLNTGEKRYVRHADLLVLPTTKLKVRGEFSEGTQEVTALFLDDFWAALPCVKGTDTLLATCNDGYASIYRREFVKHYRPFIILQIEGKDPETWSVGEKAFNPGPYVVTVSSDVVPGVATLLDANHKRPWGVVELEVTTYKKRFHALSEGLWASLSPAGRAGREIWVNSCYSCHQGPPGSPGGTKSDRPFALLASHATQNSEYFKRYIQNPQALVPAAKMEKHSYTDAQFAELIAFVSADGKWKPEK